VAMLQATDAANLVLVMDRIQVVNETLILLDEEVDETRANLTAAINARIRTINNVSGTNPAGDLFMVGHGITLLPAISPNTIDVRNTGILIINNVSVGNTTTGELTLVGDCGIDVNSGPGPTQVTIDACTLATAINNIDAMVSVHSTQISALNTTAQSQQAQIDSLANAQDLINAALNGTVIDVNSTLVSLVNEVINLQNTVQQLQDQVSNITTAQVLVGTMVAWGGGSVPIGYLACDGSIVAVSAYPDLYSILGNTYCISGCTPSVSFALPDLRGRVPAGSGGTILNTRGTVAGTETVTLSTAHMPLHSHGIQSSGTHQHDVWLGYSSSMQSATATECWNGNRIYGVFGTGGGLPTLFGTGGFSPSSGACTGFNPNGDAEWYPKDNRGANFPPFNGASPDGDHNHGGTTQSQGSSSAHPNIQPTLVVTYIIRAETV